MSVDAGISPARSVSAATSRASIRAIITLDLHEEDVPDDIHVAAESLAAAGVRATLFVPSVMLSHEKFRGPLRAIAAGPHEFASHGHLHDWNEIDALMSGDRARLAFLAESRQRHAEFFGREPVSFRSPRWCTLGPAALDELSRLGYRADSSATPQRFPLFSSAPFRTGWMLSPRAPHRLRPGLLEIPTSTLLVPFGAPTVLTLRGLVHAMAALLEFEETLFHERVIVLQSHVVDWNRSTREPRRIADLHWELLDRLSRLGLGTVADSQREWAVRLGRGGRSPDSDR